MFRIIKKSWIWFGFSILLGILSILAIIFFGLRLGIDYRGGTVLQFTSPAENRIDIAKDILDGMNITGYQIKESGKESVMIRSSVLSNDQHAAFTAKMVEKSNPYTETQYDTVGPTISRELTNKSVIAILIASLAIITFIAFAFRKVPKPLSSWKFGVCAVVALVHDLLITTGFVAVLGHFFIWMEIDALFITALLTIMGFSVHDTIVVYDRLRENLIRNPHQDIEMTAEESINQTLVRSINTSMTTIIVLTALLIFGSASIRHFIVTLVFGIAIGTYSSIFNATPLLIFWQKKAFKKPSQAQ